MKDLCMVMQPFLQKQISFKKAFHAELFNEECDLVFKESLDMLKVIFDSYKMENFYCGRRGKYLSYMAWFKLLEDGKVEESVPRTSWGAAFQLAKSMEVDELESWRNMEFSFVEFLFSLAALVRFRSDY